MTICPHCHQSYLNYVVHISTDPPAPDACTAVARALSWTWTPWSETERGRVNQANVAKRKGSVPGKGIRVRA